MTSEIRKGCRYGELADLSPGEAGEVSVPQAEAGEDPEAVSGAADGDVVKRERKIMKIKKVLSCGIFLILLIISPFPALAGWEWEGGGKVGYDSNLDRAMDNAIGSPIATAFLSLNRNPGLGSGLNWSLFSSLEGNLYFNLTDLNSAQLTVAPGLNYSPDKIWNVNLSPFIQAKGVSDSDQSAVAWGVKVTLKEQINDRLYSGQYYRYKNSTANAETYSFVENALGIFLGYNWTKMIFSEIGYEFSKGDTFLTSGEGQTFSEGGGKGKGKNRRYSQAFDSVVVRTDATRQVIGLTLGIDWSKNFYSLVEYAFTTIRTDLGDANSQAAFFQIGYRF